MKERGADLVESKPQRAVEQGRTHEKPYKMRK
jgi:hypothetical protein